MAQAERIMLDSMSDADLKAAFERIASGSITVFPTDTVYGIGCDARCAASVARVFSIKHRDTSKALPVFVCDAETALPWVEPPSRDVFSRLAAAFWPGALTIVIDTVRAGLFTQPEAGAGAASIGFRAPRQDGLLRLLSRGLFIAQTSLNESGDPVVQSLSSPEALKLLQQVDLVLESSQAPVGRPSTVVRLTAGSWTMLREGDISAARVASALGERSE